MEAIRGHVQIKTLFVDENGICSEGASAIARALADP